MLTVIYLLAPTVLFAAGWLRPPYAVVGILILLLVFYVGFKELYQELRRQKYRWESRKLFYCAVVFLMLSVWVLLSGIGGFGFQNPDYGKHNGLLKDLIEQPWPIHLMLNGVRQNLVYYVAYYLPAAAAGKLSGWVAANYFMLIWSLGGVLLSFHWFKEVSRIDPGPGLWRLAAFVAFFCLAGGLDLFGALYLRNDLLKISRLNEWWAGFFQYSSNTNLLYAVPQQAIPSWLVIGLITDSISNPRTIKYLGIAFFSGILWTPLGMLGVLPFLCAALIMIVLKDRCALFERQNFILNALSVWIGSVHVLYIASNQFKFPVAFAWSGVEDLGRLFKYILAFVILEFFLLAFLLLVLLAITGLYRNKTNGNMTKSSPSALVLSVERSGLLTGQQLYFFVLCLAILSVLPFIKIGIYNDFVMRASIPALFIFWSVTAKVLFDLDLRARIRQNFLYSLILVVVLIGFHPAMVKIVDSVRKYHFGPPPLQETAGVSSANSEELVLQMAGDDGSVFYKYIGK